MRAMYTGMFSLTGPTDEPSPTTAHSWRPLQLLNVYRAVLALLFVALISLAPQGHVLGEHNPSLFLSVALLYLAACSISAITALWHKPSFLIQVFAQTCIDIAAITLLMHASGGLESGLGVLLVVAIAGGGLLIARRAAIFLAALATIAVLLQQVFVILYAPTLDTNFAQAGLLGGILFLTAGVAQFLARRIRASEALAAQRGVDLANMEQLTEYVIQRMQTGIIVVDAQDRIRLINESAWHLLGMPPGPSSRPLREISATLTARLNGWRERSQQSSGPVFRASATAPEVAPRFARLGRDHSAGTLIFLEDTSAMAQQAQQLKLASLGRFTASIAHEVRNPLGAISHAGQLLAESPHLDKNEARLTQIILDHSKRVNTIIENILQLSRRQAARPEELSLKAWLDGFIDEFCRAREVHPAQIAARIEPPDVRVLFDPSQLHQVLWNLCDNGLRHTHPTADGHLLRLEGGTGADSPVAFLDVVDFGSGIPAEQLDHLFEPFFTTSANGTGLGLYIAKELCEGNQARLNLAPNPQGGARFRVTFADSRRLQHTNHGQASRTHR